MNNNVKRGTIAWTDLTVPDADGVRAFYEAVAGWTSDPVSMGAYDDYNMLTAVDEKPVAGICHARGSNADLPPQWLIYIIVEDLDASIAACNARGGTVISGPQDMGSTGRYCVIRDPAGAVAALFHPPSPDTD